MAMICRKRRAAYAPKRYFGIPLNIERKLAGK
jgi:hypothetical protein